MYRLLVVEDDPDQRQGIIAALKEYPENFIIDEAAGFDDALGLICERRYDMFFLDIVLEPSACEKNGWNSDGVELGRRIRGISLYAYTPIVFITSIPERVQEVLKDTRCYQYLLKPYQKEDILQCLNLLLHSPLVKEPQLSFLSFWGGRVTIPEKDVLYFTSSLGHRIAIVTEDGSFETLDYTLNALEETLQQHFFRCHRRYLIQTRAVTDYDRTRRLIRIGKHEIPLGRTYKDAFEKLWNLINQ